MELLIQLLEKSHNKVIYRFGHDHLDGIMEIDLQDINNSKIISMPSDGVVEKGYANKAFGRMLNLATKGEYPKETSYVSYWWVGYMQLTRMSKMYDIGDKVRIKKSGVIGTVVDANVSDDSWYIVEDDVKRDGKYELHDCIEEELEIVI